MPQGVLGRHKDGHTDIAQIIRYIYCYYYCCYYHYLYHNHHHHHHHYYHLLLHNLHKMFVRIMLVAR